MYCPRSEGLTARARQRGAALIVALLVFALAATLIVGLQRDFNLHLRQMASAMTGEQGWHYLLGAEELAISVLKLDAEQDLKRDEPRDDLTEIWAAGAAPYALDEGGWLLGEVEDLQGRFNLNALADAGSPGGDETDSGTDTGSDTESGDTVATRFTPAQKQFVRLLQALEGVTLSENDAIALADAVIDFIDPDDQPRPMGVESETYTNANPPYRAANQPLASVSELRAVAGMTPKLYAALAPFVTVWPATGGKVNFHTAPLPVLRSLNVDEQLQPLGLADAGRIVEQREQGSIPDVEALLADMAFGGGSTGGLSNRLTGYSSWFLLTARLEFADRELRLYSVLERAGGGVYRRYRSRGEL